MLVVTHFTKSISRRTLYNQGYFLPCTTYAVEGFNKCFMYTNYLYDQAYKTHYGDVILW